MQRFIGVDGRNSRTLTSIFDMMAPLSVVLAVNPFIECRLATRRGFYDDEDVRLFGVDICADSVGLRRR